VIATGASCDAELTLPTPDGRVAIDHAMRFSGAHAIISTHSARLRRRRTS
jgi:hypothetical protein